VAEQWSEEFHLQIFRSKDQHFVTRDVSKAVMQLCRVEPAVDVLLGDSVAHLQSTGSSGCAEGRRESSAYPDASIDRFVQVRRGAEGLRKRTRTGASHFDEGLSPVLPCSV
jgi:hypothetical protein